MLRFTAPAFALLFVFSLAPLGHGEAGDRGERHRIVKQQKFRMIDRKAIRSDRRHIRRVVVRAAVSVKVDGGGRSFHRRHRQDNTYSGDVVIDVRKGVGQWSYGSYGADVVSVTVRSTVKIIDVGSLTINSACQMQAGVCVIRP